MDNEKEYRKKKLRIELKQDIAIVSVSVLFVVFLWILAFHVHSFLRTVLMIAAIIYVIPLVIFISISIMMLHRKKHWSITVGSIEEIILEREDAQPNTTARIRYTDTNGKEHISERELSTYGDDEEGNEEALRAMLEKDRNKYEGKQVPVYFWPAHPEQCLVMLEDAFTEN